MPIYTFENKNTGEEVTLELTNDERLTYLEENKDMFQTIKSVKYVADSHRIGVNAKPSNEFRNILSRIKKSHPGSTINDF